MALSFRLGKIPVRILPSFFVMTVFLGMWAADLRIAAWVIVVLVSVLVMVPFALLAWLRARTRPAN